MRAVIDESAAAARARRQARRQEQLHHMLADAMAARVRAQLLASASLQPVLARLAAGECDLAQAMAEAWAELDADGDCRLDR